MIRHWQSFISGTKPARYKSADVSLLALNWDGDNRCYLSAELIRPCSTACWHSYTVSQLLLAWNCFAHRKGKGAGNCTKPGRHAFTLRHCVCGRVLKASGGAEGSVVLCTFEKSPSWLAHRSLRCSSQATCVADSTVQYLYCRWAVVVAHMHWLGTEYVHWTSDLVCREVVIPFN